MYARAGALCNAPTVSLYCLLSKADRPLGQFWAGKNNYILRFRNTYYPRRAKPDHLMRNRDISARRGVSRRCCRPFKRLIGIRRFHPSSATTRGAIPSRVSARRGGGARVNGLFKALNVCKNSRAPTNDRRQKACRAHLPSPPPPRLPSPRADAAARHDARFPRNEYEPTDRYVLKRSQKVSPNGFDFKYI